MIVGLGLDVCDIDRMRKNLDKHGVRFMEKVLCDDEVAYCTRKRDPATPCAGRFAAKEATIKALGAPKGMRFSDMTIHPASDHAPPRVSLSGVAREAALRMGVTRTHLTITHDANVAAAVVILEAVAGFELP